MYISTHYVIVGEVYRLLSLKTLIAYLIFVFLSLNYQLFFQAVSFYLLVFCFQLYTREGV